MNTFRFLHQIHYTFVMRYILIDLGNDLFHLVDTAPVQNDNDHNELNSTCFCLHHDKAIHRHYQ